MTRPPRRTPKPKPPVQGHGWINPDFRWPAGPNCPYGVGGKNEDWVRNENPEREGE